MKLYANVPFEVVNGTTREQVVLLPGVYDLKYKEIQPPPPGNPPRRVWIVVKDTTNGMGEQAFRQRMTLYNDDELRLEE